MSPCQQFRHLPNPIGTFDALFLAALKELLPDLAGAPWYVREHEVVNLFVFGHLIRQFQDRNLDLGQIGIEVPVKNIPDPQNSNPKRSVGADIVVWPHRKATLWHLCKPLARVEWKNISCREESPRLLEKQHDEDIRRLIRNRPDVGVSYAVLTDQRGGYVQVRAKRISEGRDPEDLFAKPARCEATCTEKAIADLQGGIRDLVLRPQACPECMAPSSATPAFTAAVSV